jgi:murein DD-endopeptidase MepM/ murein hydrolase activator NlpD
MRSIGIFVLVFVMLTSIILPLAASGSSDYMSTYVVKKGDTLSSIAAAHGVTVSSIVKENGISASATIYPGQKLRIAGATSVDEDSTTVFGASSKISIDFSADADLVGVIETIIAHTGYHVVYKGAAAKVPAIQLENVTPIAAIDYVLRMVDMTYIKNDNIIYIGTAEVLNSSFIDNKALTKFQTKYISVEELMSQLSVLGIDVKLVKSDINLREFWVSGYPMELAKMRELIKTLDNKKNITVGSAKISSSLTAIELEHLTASEFKNLLSELGLHSGIVMNAHPMTLYVYASGDAYKDIINIKKLVDYYDPNAEESKPEGEGTEGEGTEDGGTQGDVVISDGETSLVRVDLQYIDKATASEIVSNFGYEVDILGIEVAEKTVWLRGKTDDVNDAVERITESDVPENSRAKVFFTYDLKNIVASELQKKIAYVETEGVDFYFGSYPQFSKSIMVYCPENKKAEITSIIEELDNNLDKMYYPIATITDEAEAQTVDLKVELVVKLLNNPEITIDAFTTSKDLDPSEESAKYVVYVYESSENIDAIISMWDKIG